MYRQKTWKRVAVLFAGPGMNFVIGLVHPLRHRHALGAAEPAPAARPPRRRNRLCRTGCQQGELAECDGVGPAAVAGIKAGDIVVKVGDTDVKNFDEMVAAVRKADRSDGVRHRAGRKADSPPPSTSCRPSATRRRTPRADVAVGAVGIAAAEFAPCGVTQYNPLTAVPGTVAFTGDLAVEIGKSLAKIPTKIGALVHSIGGGERDPETPISVVGASIIGGDTFERGLWVAFWFFLAQLNFVLGAINLLPLLPFDGGHIAVAVFEKIRNMLRKARGMAPQRR